MPSKTLRINLGAILIGTLLNLALYTIEITQVVAYFTSERRKKDKLWIKLCVVFNLVVDTVASFASWAGIFIYSVLNWGHFEDLQHNVWPLVMVIVVDGLGTFSVQSFMVYRYWKMSSNRIITSFILLCMILTMGGTLRTGIATAVEPSLAKRTNHLNSSIFSFAGNCVTDLSITCALLYKLHINKHSIFTPNTKELLWRVTILVITTGCVPSVFTTTGVVLLAVLPKTYLATAVAFMYGRIYALTMLYTLNLRDKIRGEPWVHSIDVISSRVEGKRFQDSDRTAVSRRYGRKQEGSDSSTATYTRKRADSAHGPTTVSSDDTFAEFLRDDSIVSSSTSSSYPYDYASALEEGHREGTRYSILDMLRSPADISRPPMKKTAVVHRILLPDSAPVASCPSLHDMKRDFMKAGKQRMENILPSGTETEKLSSTGYSSAKKISKARTL